MNFNWFSGCILGCGVVTGALGIGSSSSTNSGTGGRAESEPDCVHGMGLLMGLSVGWSLGIAMLG